MVNYEKKKQPEKSNFEKKMNRRMGKLDYYR
jgi:hypothetical protein